MVSTTASPSVEQKPKELGPIGKILTSALSGSIVGAIYYGYNRIFYMEKGIDKVFLNPSGFIIAGVTSCVFKQIVSLIYDLGVYILGDREKVQELEANSSAADRMRRRTWKVLDKVDQLQVKIDVVFSRVLQIRTLKEIRENKIREIDLSIVEVVRLAFLEQIPSTVMHYGSWYLGVKVAVLCGFSVFGGPLTIGLVGSIVLVGVALKIITVYFAQKRAEQIKRTENQITELLNIIKDEKAEIASGQDPSGEVAKNVKEHEELVKIMLSELETLKKIDGVSN